VNRELHRHRGDLALCQPERLEFRVCIFDTTLVRLGDELVILAVLLEDFIIDLLIEPALERRDLPVLSVEVEIPRCVDERLCPQTEGVVLDDPLAKRGHDRCPPTPESLRVALPDCLRPRRLIPVLDAFDVLLVGSRRVRRSDISGDAGCAHRSSVSLAISLVSSSAMS